MCVPIPVPQLHWREQVGDLVFTPDGLAVGGLLVRHLVMPGGQNPTFLHPRRTIIHWPYTWQFQYGMHMQARVVHPA